MKFTKKPLRYILFIVSHLISISFSIAQTSLPAIFGDHMVFQQQEEARIWGQSVPNSSLKIYTSWNKKYKAVQVEANGKWKSFIKTPKAGGPYSIFFFGKDTLVLNDVLIGEVWFASGQSNMEMKLQRTNNSEQEVANANYPEIRLFKVPRAISDKESSSFEETAAWQECSSESAANFSAIAYFYARKLYAELGVPIGIISAAWGGTPAEAWMNKKILQSDTAFNKIFKRWDLWENESEEDNTSYQVALKEWQKESQNTLAKKPEIAQSAYMTSRPHRKPSVLYNGMVAPIIPFTIRGVIWFQGTSNKTWYTEYSHLFKTLINSWREVWQKGNFPFYYVQNAPFNFQHPEEGDGIRQGQLDALELTNTGMVVTMDLGEKDNLHPKNKEPIGNRLALWALAKTYDYKNLVYSGPLYKSHKIENNGIRIYFNHLGSGLTSTGGELRNFQISGEDKIFFSAKAVIQGNSIFVISENAPRPVAVRYGFGNVFNANFISKEGLQASPFKTDDWEIKKVKK